MKHLLLSSALLLTPLTLTAQTTAQEEEDKGYLTELIEENLSGVSRTVTINGFKGALSSSASLDLMSIADSEGVWLTLENVVLVWNRSALLRGRLEVEELSASRLLVARAPVSEDTAPSPEAAPFALPELPVSVTLGKLQIDRIELGDSFLGEPVVVSLTGDASLADGEGAANINATRLDGARGTFLIDGSFDNASKVLGLNLTLDEGADGIVARLLDLPGRPSVGLSVTGTAPVTDYTAAITLATDGQDRVTGDVRVTNAEGLQSFAVDIGGDVSPLLAPDYQDFFGTDVALTASGRQLADGRLDLNEFDLSAQSIQMKGSALIGAEGWPERLSLNGTVADTGGDVVLLPLTGPKTFVDRVSLAIGYDQAQSEDWSAEFAISGFDRPGLLIRELTLDGGGILRPGEGDAIGEITADFAYAARGLQLDDTGMAEALGDEITGVIQASRIEDAPVNLSRLTLAGPGIEVEGDATISGPKDGFRTQSTLLLTVAAIERFSTLAGRELAGDGTLAISSAITPLDGLFDVVLTGQTSNLAFGMAQLDPLLAGDGTIAVAAVRDTEGTRLTGLTLETPSARITAKAELTSGASDAEFDVSVSDIGLILPDLSGPATLTGNAQRDEALRVTFDVTGTGPAAILSAKGEANPAEAGQTINATITANIRDLQTYAALAGRPLAGAVNADLTGVILSDGLRFDGNLSATTRDLQTGVAQLDPLLRGNGTLDVALNAPSDGVYGVKGLVLRTPSISLDADADIDLAGPLSAVFDLRLTDAGQVIAGISGPLTAKGSAARDTGGIATVDVLATGPGATIDADVSIAPETNEISGLIDAEIVDLAVYADLIGQPLAGGIKTRINGTLLPDLSRFDAQVSLATSNLSSGNATADPLLRGAGTVALDAALTAEGLQVRDIDAAFPNVTLKGGLDTANGQGSGRFDARLRDIGLIAPGLSGPATAVGTATQDTAGNWAVKATTDAQGISADADVTIASTTNEIAGTVNATVGDLRPFQRLIGQPVSGGVALTVSGRLLPDLSNLNLDLDIRTESIGIGNTTADLLLRGPGTLVGQVTLENGALSIDNFAAQTPNVTISGTLDGRAGAGRGQFDARLRDVGLLTDTLSGPVTATGTGSLDASGNWGVNASGTGPGGITLRADGTVGAGGTLAIDLTGQAPLGLANAALEPRRIDGSAVFDLSVNGPAQLSSVAGNITIDGARLTAPLLGLAVSDMQGGLTLSNGNAQIDLTGQVESGGALQITGPVGLSGGYDADITANLRNVILRDPELYETIVNGAITARGPLSGGARIAGTLDLGQTDIQVPSSGVGSLGDLPKVTHIGASGQVRQTLTRAGADEAANTAAAATAASGPAYPLNLTINAPSRVFIRGRGLDAELGGSLTLTGTSKNIIPAGQFSLVRGRIDILQQRFDLTEGVASLQGDFEPYLRLVATTESRTGTVIRIVVEGPASEPEVSFNSIPDLPQDEVLSQLIFGRNLSEISPLQAVQLASAVATLAGRGGGGLIDGFREGIGLDDFDVTTDDDGNAALRAGKYLSENVYTDVTIASDGSTEINLNLDITDEITAKGTVDAAGDTSIGIYFERDY